MNDKIKLAPGKKLLRSLLILFGSMLILGLIGCIIFYRYAAVYEVTRPELYMDELMESMSEQVWYTTAIASDTDAISEFENTQDIFSRFYETNCKGKELTYREAFSENEKEEAKFIIRAGSCNLYNVVLTARDDIDPGFNRHYWKLESISLADFTSSLASATVEVYALADNEVLINSVPVGEKYFSETASLSADSNGTDRFNSGAQFRKYSIGKLYGDILVTDSEGNEITADYDEENSVYRYVYCPETSSVTIEAPEDVKVTLCGVELTREDASSVKDSIFKNLTSYTAGQEWDTLVYSFDGIYGEPYVTAVDADGTTLEPVVTDSGKLVFFHANNQTLQENAEASVSKFFDAYMAYSSSRGRVYDLLDCTLRGTRLNSYIRYSTEGMYWASDTYVDYDELEFSNFYPLGDDCLFCTIQFKGNFSAQAWYESYSYEMRNGYEMVFVKYGNSWLAAEMSAFA